jgi:hypothetical protein
LIGILLLFVLLADNIVDVVFLIAVVGIVIFKAEIDKIVMGVYGGVVFGWALFPEEFQLVFNLFAFPDYLHLIIIQFQWLYGFI